MITKFLLKLTPLLLCGCVANAAAGLSDSNFSRVNPTQHVYLLNQADQLEGYALRRIYSSGSTYRGLFGLGWCSELDGRLVATQEPEQPWRFEGCDLRTGASLSRNKGTSESVGLRLVRKRQRGAWVFVRQTEAGGEQEFSPDGLLQEIRSPGRLRITIERGRNGLIQGLRVGSLNQFVTPVRSVRMSFEERVTQLGRIQFEYQNFLLIRAGMSGYRYSEYFNLVEWRHESHTQEEIRYDEKSDQVVEVQRQTPDRVERLLLAAGEGGSGGEGNLGRIEIKLEIRERGRQGAEMHPVRFLFNALTDSLAIEGDRRLVPEILHWLAASPGSGIENDQT